MKASSISSNPMISAALLSAPVASTDQRVTGVASSTGFPATPSREVHPQRLRQEERVTIDSRTAAAGREKRDSMDSSAHPRPIRSMDEILFAYNAKGDLRIRFTDSVSKLVYQMPPVLFARAADLVSNPRSSVDTRV